MQDQPKIKVFLSYSHDDEDMKIELERHLSTLAIRGHAIMWSDRKMLGGTNIDDEVITQLKSSDVCIPLISSNFLSSNYCYNIELKLAMELRKQGKMCVIPVVIKSVDWEGLDVSKLLTAEKDAIPITNWTPTKDEGYKSATIKIRETIEALIKTRSTSSPANSPISNLHLHPKNNNFTGRASYLKQIEQNLTTHGQAHTTTITQAIHGLGGIGKTQLALKYAWDHYRNYDIIWWLRSETTATLDPDFLDLALALGLDHLKHVTDRKNIILATTHHLSKTNKKALLIFDNVETFDSIKDHIPYPAPGATPAHIIITTRNPNWGAHANPIQLELMPEDEAVQFLTEKTNRPAESGPARALALELGRLPLALEHARAYIEENNCPIAEYLDLFKQHHAELLKHAPPPDQYAHTVLTTWELAFDRINQNSPAAESLMNLCAFLAPDDIPLDIFTKYHEHLPEPLKSAAANKLAFNRPLAELRKYSLIDKKDTTFAIHRLVQDVTRHRLAANAPQWAAHAAALMSNAFTFDEKIFETWPESKPLFNHAVAAADHAYDSGIFTPVTDLIYYRTAKFSNKFAFIQQAKTLALKAVEAGTNVYGEKSPETAMRRVVLAGIIDLLGDPNTAKTHYLDALDVLQTHHGENHPDVALCLNNAGLVFNSLGNSKEALKYYELSLKIKVDYFGENHPDVAPTLNNIGCVFNSLGNSNKALEYYDKSLKIFINNFGENHPDVAITLNNIGSAYKRLGNSNKAMEYYENALKIQIDNFGENHPDVAKTLNNIGMVFDSLGNSNKAMEYYDKSLKIFINNFGENHPDVATTLNNIGIVFDSLGNSNKALEYLDKSLKITVGNFGENHPDVATSLYNIGTLLFELGKTQVAEQHLEKAYTIFQETYGNEHLDTKKFKKNLKLVKKKNEQKRSRSKF